MKDILSGGGNPPSALLGRAGEVSRKGDRSPVGEVRGISGDVRTKAVRGEKEGAEGKTEERTGGDGDTEWLFGGGGRRGAEGRFERGRAKGRVGREGVVRAGLRLASL